MKRLARILLVILAVLTGAAAAPAWARSDPFQQPVPATNAKPTSVEEVSRLIAAHDGPVSIGGARYSQGGQTTCDNCLFLDMSGMNRILDIDVAARTIRVEAGATWRQILEKTAPLGLAPRVMQSYANFSVGGSLSVNAHGRYAGEGPIIGTVRSIRLVLADGSVVTASRDGNRDLFDAAIGGYGGIGVIVEATLDLAPDQKLEKTFARVAVSDYPAFYTAHIAGHPEVVLHTAILYPPDFRTMNVITATVTDKPLTESRLLRPVAPISQADIDQQHFVAYSDLGKWYREAVYDPTHSQSTVVMRSFEAAEAVESIAPPTPGSAFMLQEYFVPVDRFAAFVPAMSAIFHKRHVNVVTLSVRRAKADTESLLAWAKNDVYAFVVYYAQPTTAKAEAEEAAWTREMLDRVIADGGSWYMPYKVLATREQFVEAFPRAGDFFAVKRRVDPANKFRNRLWDAYYRP